MRAFIFFEEFCLKRKNGVFLLFYCKRCTKYWLNKALVFWKYIIGKPTSNLLINAKVHAQGLSAIVQGWDLLDTWVSEDVNSSPPGASSSSTTFQGHITGSCLYPRDSESHTDKQKALCHTLVCPTSCMVNLNTAQPTVPFQPSAIHQGNAWLASQVTKHKALAP